VPERVLEWGESATLLPEKLRYVVAALATAAAVAAIYYGTTEIYLPFLSVLIAEAVLRRFLEKARNHGPGETRL